MEQPKRSETCGSVKSAARFETAPSPYIPRRLAQATAAGATKTHLARHQCAAIRTRAHVLRVRTARRLTFRIYFTLHGYILSLRRESNEVLSISRLAIRRP